MSTDGSQRALTPKTAPRAPIQKKLRSSCDACSASKIKCNQERPSCLRCRSIEVKCNYSASRRMGKPPASRDANGIKSTKSKTVPAKKEIRASLLSIQKWESDSIPRSNLAPLNLEAYFMDSDDLIPTQWQTVSFYSPGSSTNSNNDASVAPMSLFDHDLNFLDDAESDLLAPRTSTDDMFIVDDICMDLRPSKSNDTFTSLDELTGQTLKPNHQPLFQTHDCTTLASSTIQLLRLDSSTCGASATPNENPFHPISSIDQVLINNRSAIENVRSLLGCPCSLGPQYALTIALIIHNILVCYEAIIRATSNVRAEPGNTLWPDNLRATPITVGAYKIDAEDDQRMRIQLVVNELRKVRALVEKYAERYCTSKENEARNAGIYSALDIFLQTKLKQAVGDMVSTLRG
ncbi:hypothetical protein V499_04723 [Pseudogymnoascus sp. VKM F-103]|nr:hypothetical protein V499_04723 [Pseudogymnoascus sp. VKM F-103]